MSNWQDRTVCRGCSKPKAGTKPGAPRPGAAAAQPAAANAATAPPARGCWADFADEEDKEKEKATRPPAPEARCAEAAKQAAALETSSAALRTAGLAEKADELDAEAARLRKVAASTPPPGRRLDLLQGFVARAEGRALKAAKELETMKKAFEEAESAKAAADKEHEDAKQQLETLKRDLAAADTEMPDADGNTQVTVAGAEPELARLRSQLRQAETARDAAFLASGHAAPQPSVPLTREAEAALEDKLKKVQANLTAALGSGTSTAQQAGEFAVLTAQLEAARSKRRRAEGDASSAGAVEASLLKPQG